MRGATCRWQLPATARARALPSMSGMLQSITNRHPTPYAASLLTGVHPLHYSVANDPHASHTAYCANNNGGCGNDKCCSYSSNGAQGLGAAVCTTAPSSYGGVTGTTSSTTCAASESRPHWLRTCMLIISMMRGGAVSTRSPRARAVMDNTRRRTSSPACSGLQCEQRGLRRRPVLVGCLRA